LGEVGHGESRRGWGEGEVKLKWESGKLKWKMKRNAEAGRARSETLRGIWENMER
jgi:hypothetical protein